MFLKKMLIGYVQLLSSSNVLSEKMETGVLTETL